MPAHHSPVWRHTDDGLAIRLGNRVDPVPAPVVTWLIGLAGSGTSADVANDLLDLESRLHADIAASLIKVREAETVIASARRGIETPAWSWNAWTEHRRRRAVARNLRKWLHRHSDESDLLDEVRHAQLTLRRFVVELDVPTGLLARAAAGWQRSATPPPGVILFEAEDNFLTVDQRRADTHRGYAMIAGPTFGRQWRRDGDDQVDVPHEHSGTWVLGYIPRTREIYASRRSGYLAQQVWVLGSDVDAEQAHQMLSEIEPRMREPNSMILAANIVHAARALRTPNEKCVPITVVSDSTRTAPVSPGS